MMIPQHPIRIVIADDHPMVRESLRIILDNQPDMQVIGACEDGRAAVEMVLQESPDVALLDLQMPRMGGADAAIAILQKRPEVCILLLSAYNGEAEIRQAMQAGVRGFFWKDASKAEMLFAIREALQGRNHSQSGT